MPNNIEGSGPPGLTATGADHSHPASSCLLMQRLEAAVAKAPSSDELHVQVIKDALARSEYTVDAGRIAAKLMKFECLLPRKP